MRTPLFLFAIAGTVTAAPPGEPGAHTAPAAIHRQIVTTASETYHVEIPGAVRNRWIAITNAGTETIVNPRLIANGKRDWFSTADILAGIITPAMTGREKALAIWRFLVVNRYHDAPAHTGIEMHDPVRFLNVYGYGFCDDSATNFMELAKQAGLQSRVWGLSGHVVHEAFFEGGWHVLDPDGQIYYLEDDGRTIAGIKTLEQRPDLFHKYPSPYYKDSARVAAIYTSAENNRAYDGSRKNSEAVHTMAFSLRPGESLTRHHGNWGVYFASRDAPRPPKATGKEHYGNGRIVFEPVFANGVFSQGTTSINNVRAEREGDGWVLTSGEREGTLVYRFAGPYPYLDGAVRIAGRGQISLLFSETGDTWAGVWNSQPDASVDTTVPLGAYFRRNEGRPMYAYHLKLTINGRVRALRFQSDIQVAPASLPALEPGDNTLQYRDATSGNRHVQIELAYDPGATN